MPVPWPAPEPDLERAAAVAHRWARDRFEYMPDGSRWDRPDYWASDADLIAELAERGAVTGDCDDFALLARLVLRLMGHPSRLLMCVIETGETHLVTEAGGWVLDNRQQGAATREELERIGYRWTSMSGYNRGDPWTTVAP